MPSKTLKNVLVGEFWEKNDNDCLHCSCWKLGSFNKCCWFASPQRTPPSFLAPLVLFSLQSTGFSPVLSSPQDAQR